MNNLEENFGNQRKHINKHVDRVHNRILTCRYSFEIERIFGFWLSFLLVLFFFLSCAFGFGCFHLSVDFQMDIFSIRRTFKWHYFHLTLNNEQATILNVAIALSGLFIPNHMNKMNDFGLWSLSCRTFRIFLVFWSRFLSWFLAKCQ